MSQADAQRRLDEELDQLAEQRRLLADSLVDDREPGDSADQAQAVEHAAELQRLDQRIADLRARRDPDVDAGAGSLPVGTRVVLRYADGDTESVEVAPAPADPDAGPVITPDSPVARAVAGHTAGDTITWDAPAGTTSAELVELRRP